MEEVNTNSTPTAEPGANGGASNEPGNNSEKVLTQAEVDSLIEKRLARARKKWVEENNANREPSRTAGSDVLETNKGATETAPVKVDDEVLQRLKVLEVQNTLLANREKCYSAGVKNEFVDDVIVLAERYKDDDKTFKLYHTKNYQGATTTFPNGADTGRS